MGIWGPRIDQEPDINEPPYEPTREEEAADAWEYWHARAMSAETEIARLRSHIATMNEEREQERRWFNNAIARHLAEIANLTSLSTEEHK